MNIRKVELKTDEREYGTMYEIHVYPKFKREPVILYLSTWDDWIILSLIDFLKRLTELKVHE